MVTQPESTFEMVRRAQIEADSAWHLDKKIPIAIILALALQTAGAFWWAGKADERLSALERKVDQAAPQGDRLTRVETKLESVQDGILEIKSILRKEPPVPKSR